MLRRVEKCVSLLAEHIAMVLLVLMTAVVCYTVLTRYVFSYTPAWGEEFALLCMVWFGFLSIALGVRDDGHIGVTILDKYFSQKSISIMNIFKYLCTLGFAVFMIFEGWKLTLVGMHNQFPGLGITSAWLYGVVPLAGIAIFVYSIEKIIDNCKTPTCSPIPGGDAS